ncbi:Pvc16 family protein [Streptomyces sp. NPDC090021]|uniref:Pvc16 family protein n=1 Tax=Streptomyces sp. NPDC090021 TaxID=3365919 RepID=UPI00382EA7CC
MVLYDTTASLRRFLGSVPAPADGIAVFAGPPTQWDTFRAVNPRGLGLFLHDVRESPLGVPGDWSDVRSADGRVVARRAPVRRYELSFALWAWADDDPMDECALLSAVLAAASGRPCLPEWCMEGAPAEYGHPPRLRVAPAERVPRSPLWEVAGLPPRTVLELVVTADLWPDATTATDPVVRERRVRLADRRAPRGGTP